jgi:hypothetical protein
VSLLVHHPVIPFEKHQAQFERFRGRKKAPRQALRKEGHTGKPEEKAKAWAERWRGRASG